MNKIKLVKTLKNLGLSENEAEVYFAALSLGPTTIKKIAETSGVKRTSVYNIVGDLKKIGLMHIELSGLKQQFVAENPATLHEMAERRKSELEEMLPDFMKVFEKTATQDSIKFVEGLAAVRGLYRSLPTDLKKGDHYYIITNQERWYALDKGFSQNFVEKRAEMGLDIKMLTQDSATASEFITYQKNYGMSIKLLPKQTDLNTNTVITPKRVVVQQLTFPIVALVIENKSIIQMHQQLFGIIWDSLPE